MDAASASSWEIVDMAVHIVRLGTPRAPDEGVRLGTVRRPPRGVPKGDIARRDFYDAWLPELAPSAELLSWVTHDSMTDARWRQFSRRYRAEMRRPEAQHLLGVLAALSRRGNVSVGCYCADETRCHRSILRELLVDAGADVA
jgi:uncharacterized protein YeaO (DUF488 family)